MANATAITLIQTIANEHVRVFADRLSNWLIEDLNQGIEDSPAFTESRARALLRAADLIDDPTLHSFARLIENEMAVRLALHDLLQEAGLAENDEVKALAHSPITQLPNYPIAWLPLAIAAFAWRAGYPLHQLDPSSPPEAYSPAGQVLKRAAYFIRQQVQRSATERDKLGRQLAYTPGASGAPDLDELRPEGTVAPLPPHFRPPIPVRYPEVARETLHVEPEEQSKRPPAVQRGEPITITGDDLPVETRPPDSAPASMPSIHVSPEPAGRRPQRPRVVTPRPGSGAGFATAVSKAFGGSQEPMKTTRLRVVVQEYPDGPGLYGLQVHVTCRGVKSHVAGTTNREGSFLCELPVRQHSGLTYDVDITWPRDHGSETERKSITLNVDRTEFTLPFYRRLKQRPATGDQPE